MIRSWLEWQIIDRNGRRRNFFAETKDKKGETSFREEGKIFLKAEIFHPRVRSLENGE